MAEGEDMGESVSTEGARVIKPLSQRDKRWASLRLGTCSKATIGTDGCAITCVAMLTETTPDKVNDLGLYTNGCLANWSKLAQVLDLQYSLVRNRALAYPCIAETKLSGNQHFIVVDGEKQYDPWDGKVYQSKYEIISYRNLTPKSMDKEQLVRALYKVINQVPTQQEIEGHLKAPTYDVLLSGFFKAYRGQVLQEVVDILDKLRR